MESTFSGTSMPSVLAILRLITNSNLVDCYDRQVRRFLALENVFPGVYRCYLETLDDNLGDHERPLKRHTCS